MSPKVEPSLRIGLTLLMSQTMKKKRATKYHKKIAVAFSAMLRYFSFFILEDYRLVAYFAQRFGVCDVLRLYTVCGALAEQHSRKIWESRGDLHQIINGATANRIRRVI